MTILQKRNLLLIILATCSLLQGFLLAKLDFFGFLTGEHAINTSYVTWIVLAAYCSTLCVFLLDFAREKNTPYLFIGMGALYAFPFFLLSETALFTLVTSLLYLSYLYFVYYGCQKKSALYIEFRPKEILFPVMRDGLLFMLAMFAAISFFRAQERTLHNTLFEPSLLRPITAPFVHGFNKQLSQELTKQFGPVDSRRIITPLQREEIYLTLEATVDQMARSNDNKVAGIDREAIEIRRTTIYDDGSIDIGPVVVSALPEIGMALNTRIKEYSYIAPLVVAIAIFLILQPLTYPIHWIERMISRLLFSLLRKYKFIKITKESRDVDVVSL
ncbi:MAG: hypothetical protein UZ21_OP11001000072 [Microgenomates bacterium OLB22]|nr:MAG: hypothetical protein UZ21_OP11001000072 [Microgenomates bacterium OLB22]